MAKNNNSLLKEWAGKLHLWLGLASGIVVVILGITGSLYVFVEDLRPIVYKDRYFIEVPANATKLPLSILKEKAQQALGENNFIRGVEIPQAPNRTYIFNSRKNNKKGWFYGSFVEFYKKAYINPYTGALVNLENTKFEFFTLVLALHRTLWLNQEVGSSVIGTSVLSFLFILITGLILWWPKNKNETKQRFKIKWDAKWKRLNFDLHAVSGIYAYTFLLLIVFTGLYFAYDWVKHTASFTATGKWKEKELISDTLNVTGKYDLDTIYHAISKQNTTAYAISFSFPKEKKDVLGIFVRLEDGIHYKSNTYQIDQFSGKYIKTKLYADKTIGERLLAANLDVHVGAWLGYVGKIIHFIIGLIAASLPITGFLFWYGRTYSKPKSKTNKGNDEEAFSTALDSDSPLETHQFNENI